MRGVRGNGEAAGADEKGPHEVGGRLPDLLATLAARFKTVDVQAVLHEESVQWLRLGSAPERIVGQLPILQDASTDR